MSWNKDKYSSKEIFLKLFVISILISRLNRNIVFYDDTTKNNFIQLNQAYKVLSDPNLKQQYDFQYVANINKSSVAVHDNLSLDDLDGNEDGFFTPCRCGGLYQLPVETLKLSIPNLYVSCDTCSLCVLVTIVS